MTLIWQVNRSQVDPQFADDMDALFAYLPAWAVCQGWRSYAYQNGLYTAYQNGGAQADPPGHSPHEYCLPDGTPDAQAADVAMIGPDGKLSWDDTTPEWAAMIAAVRASPRLHSGMDFPPVASADPDHIQSIAWWTIRDGLQKRGNWPMRFPSQPALDASPHNIGRTQA